MAIGTIKMLMGLMAAIMSQPIKDESIRISKSATLSDLSLRKSMLLTNGFSGPEPRRIPNQRQRRKLDRQKNHH